MTLRCRSLGALLALGLLVSACGESSGPDRFGLTTPKSPASAAPAAEPEPVTDAERRVIRGWSEELRHGDVRAASKYFSVPSEIVNLPPKGDLSSEREVEVFNDSMPCGAKLLSVQRATGQLVLADFELTDRPGGECESVGMRATFAFEIDAHDHISRFILVPDGEQPPPSTTTTTELASA